MDTQRRRFLVFAGVGTVAMMTNGILNGAAEPGAPEFLDHVILGCADLEAGIAFVEKHAGVRAAFGGVHPGRGTRNALLSLGGMRYLEILAPDPAQSGQKWFPKLKDLTEPRIVGWAVHPPDLDLQAKTLRTNGVAFSGPTEGSRRKSDGTVLHWRTVNLNDDRDGLLPFLIEWSPGTRHPSTDSPVGCALKNFFARTSQAAELSRQFAVIPGADIQVLKGTRIELVAEIAGPNGLLTATT